MSIISMGLSKDDVNEDDSLGTMNTTYKNTLVEYDSNFYFSSMLSWSCQSSDSNRHKKMSPRRQSNKMHHVYIHFLEFQDQNKFQLKQSLNNN